MLVLQRTSGVCDGLPGDAGHWTGNLVGTNPASLQERAPSRDVGLFHCDRAYTKAIRSIFLLHHFIQ